MELRCTAERETHLLSILRRELQLSSTLVRRLKYCGAYTVNGEPAHTDRPVRPGDVVRVCLDEPRPDYPGGGRPLSILYEDEALLAVDKPQGMLVHPSFSRQTARWPTACSAIMTGPGRPAPSTRSAGSTAIRSAWCCWQRTPTPTLCSSQRRSTRPIMPPCAVCRSRRRASVDVPIARLSPESLLRCVRADGQPARSAYRTLRTEHGVSLLELQPHEPGRTHQLRVHCAWLGCPILGDPQYGGAESGGPGQQLCAVSIRFFHPFLKKWLEIRSKQDVLLDFPDGMVV